MVNNTCLFNPYVRLYSEEHSTRMSTKYCNINNYRYSTTHTTSAHVCNTYDTKGDGQIECGNPSVMDAIPKIPLVITQPNKCKSLACVYPHDHLTSGHRCGMCLNYGHGETECPISDNINVKVKCPICTKECDKKDVITIHEIMPKCHICYEENKHKKVCFTKCGHIPMCTSCLDTISNISTAIDSIKTVVNDHQLNLITDILGPVGPNHYTRIYGGQGSTIYAVKDSEEDITPYLLHGNNHGKYGTDSRPIIAYVIRGKRYIRPANFY